MTPILPDIYEALRLEMPEFQERYFPGAEQARKSSFGDRIAVSGLLAIGNICKNHCTYCGLRAPNRSVPRYRLSLDVIKKSIEGIGEQGIRQLFLISGEDPGLDVDDVLATIEHASEQGFQVMLGLGVFSPSVYDEMRDAGADLYALKFETSNPEIFSSVKPDISLEGRMQAVRAIQAAGLKLGSGNIIGLPGEQLSDIAGDIELMKQLDIAWAPVVPYLPAPGTPLAETQPMGSVERLLKEIALLRIILPDTLITAGQPSQDSKLGFADPQGTRDALAAGANLLFVDLTPKEQRDNFAITSNRILPRLEGIDKLLDGVNLVRE
ncbi:MAG: radical SAM protein [Alkalispirochaeta sp.]